MPDVLRFAAPYHVDLVDLASPAPAPGEVRVATIASGISAGTELTAFRGTNPYLTATWDPHLRLFDHGAQAPAYPVQGWGYSEVGRVVEAPGEADDLTPGDVVWGIWGHRAEAVLPASSLRGRRLPAGTDPVVGCFARVAAIGLNAVLAADAGVGSTVVVVGQGVIGLLATRFAVLSGARVIAVDGIDARLEHARAYGAAEVLHPTPDLARRLRDLTGPGGADAAIELSGTHPGLAEAVRAVGPDGRVVAAGFYQGEVAGLRLGEEFHHNRVQLLASQIGSVPQRLAARWDPARLHRAAMEAVVSGRVDVLPLVTHRFPLARAQEAYELLDTGGDQVLQVVLET
ncbi:zinc-binding dehydrogenase [Georgenia muralis]|uniref:2-desacetyl-2-hydroxyethyl bacteriochlorophyllide A dehydrogenase n=1 Tax=Georgenia muralis TaxID=154117 RepID=A0A3N4Z772_9MICO|nr:zinc-binding dehydrogenase [Georgenia muralis]RPF27020.1 2-desacetyl-2-hydroxyethyl bacteriochlorophyllide A dehydrogenase [Georgenia muralis]